MRFPAFILVLFVAVSGFALTPVQDIQLSGAADGGGVTFTNLGDVVLTNGVRLSTVSAEAGATNATGGGALVLGYNAATRTVTGSVSSVGTITNAVGSWRLAMGVSGATITGTVDVTGLATGAPVYSVAGLATGAPIYSVAGLATGTPIYAETSITSGVAQGQTANLTITGANRALYFTITGLATGTPVYSSSGLATGTPLYAESDAAAIAQVQVASNALRISIGALSTNDAALSNAAFAAIGGAVTNANTASNALAASIASVQSADIARAAGLSNNLAAIPGVYAARSNNLSDLTSAATARSNLGLGNAATNATTNAIYGAGTIFGLTVSTNTAPSASIPARILNGVIAPVLLGGDVTASIAGSTGMTVTVEAGAITWSKLDSNTVDAVLTRDAEMATNAVRIATLETGRASRADYITTSNVVAALNTNAVLRRGVDTAQTLTITDGATIGTNLIVQGGTLGAELAPAATWSTSLWVFSGSAYSNASQLVINDGLSGGAWFASPIALTNGEQVSVSYTISQAATAAVSFLIGGRTNVYAYAGTGATNAFVLGLQSSASPTISVATTSGQIALDAVSVRRVTGGEASMDTLYVRRIASESLASVNATDAVARAAIAVYGPQITNAQGVASNALVVASNAVAMLGTVTNLRLHTDSTTGQGATFLTQGDITNGYVAAVLGDDSMTIVGGEGAGELYSEIRLYRGYVQIKPLREYGGPFDFTDPSGTGSNPIFSASARIVQSAGQTAMLGRVFADGVGVSNINANAITNPSALSTTFPLFSTYINALTNQVRWLGNAAPTGATASGSSWEIRYDATNVYIYTLSNRWMRLPGSMSW